MNKKVILYFGIAVSSVGVVMLAMAAILYGGQPMELSTTGVKSTGAYLGAVLMILLGAVFIFWSSAKIKADLGPVDIESEPDEKPAPPPEQHQNAPEQTAVQNLQGPVTTITGAPVQKKEGG